MGGYHICCTRIITVYSQNSFWLLSVCNHNLKCSEFVQSVLVYTVKTLSNRAESPSEGISGASGGTAAGLEKDLPAKP